MQTERGEGIAMPRLKVRLLTAVAFALALGAAAPAQAAPATAKQPDEKMVALLQALADAAARNDCDAALRLGEPLVENGMRDLADNLQSIVYGMVADCSFRKGRKEKAHAYAVRGSELPGSTDGVWVIRLFIEVADSRWPEAVATIETMGHQRPTALNTAPRAW